MREAWGLNDELLSDVHVAFAEEPEDIEIAWRSLTKSTLFSTNVWADDYLAAFAVTVDFEVITFDKGFMQYRNLRRTILS